jgi:cytochrome P450
MPAKKETLEVYTPEFFLSPEPLYTQLRASEPVCRVKLPSGIEGWWITRYEDVEAALKDPRLTKNPHNVLPAGSLDGVDPVARDLYSLITSHMLYADPPDHTRLRSLAGKAFTPNLVEHLRGRVQSVTDELLDAVQTQSRMDVISDLAFPLPITVISDMLGIPEEDREQFRVWTTIIIGNTAYIQTLLSVLPEVTAFKEYLLALIERRRQYPTEDLISKLVQVEEAGDQLSSNELVAMIFLLILAGYETTANLIGNGVLALLEHPDQMHLLQQDPTLLKPAIEELLRYNGPLYSTTSRWAREDFEIRGQQIRRGEPVLLILASANHDERVFKDTEVLDITRQANHHLAFGKGIHYCLGAPLARLEGQIALGTLLRRMPNLRLAVDPQTLTWRSGLLVRGLEQLPVSF